MYTEIMTNAPDISTLLTIFSDFNDLTHTTLNNLLDKVTIKKYKKNDFIYLAEDNSVNIFLLKEGKVKIGKYSED